MSLIKWECWKIWKRRSTKIGILLAVAYMLFSTTFNAVHNLGSFNRFGGNNNDGITEITRQYEWAEQWKGELTGDKLKAALEQYKIAFQPEHMEKMEDGSNSPTDKAYDQYVKPLGSIPTFLWKTFSLLPEYGSYYAISSIPNEMAEDYYQQREKIVSQFLTSQVPDEQDRAFFQKQNAQITAPFYYDWYEGQSMYLEIIAPIPTIVALILCTITAPVYALEYQQKTDSVILSAKHGRRKLAAAKLSASMLFSTAVYAACIGIYVLGQVIFVGTRGLSCPIQLIKPIATAPITIGQTEIYAIVLGFLSCIAMTAITAALSAVMRSVFPVAVTSMAILLVPIPLNGMIPQGLEFLTTVIPFMSDYTELFRTNMYHILGMRIWAPYLMLGAPVLIAAVCVPLAQREFQRHQVM